MKIKSRNKISAEFSMSSMTDIVFLLLIFFMLTSNVPNALDLLLPKAKGKSMSTDNLAVSITGDLDYFVGEAKINPIYLEVELKKALNNKPQPTIILRADQGVPIEKAVEVLDIANQNNYKVILAVRP